MPQHGIHQGQEGSGTGSEVRQASLCNISAMPVSCQGEERLAGAEEAGDGSLLVRTRKLQQRLDNPAPIQDRLNVKRALAGSAVCSNFPTWRERNLIQKSVEAGSGNNE